MIKSQHIKTFDEEEDGLTTQIVTINKLGEVKIEHGAESITLQLEHLKQLINLINLAIGSKNEALKESIYNRDSENLINTLIESKKALENKEMLLKYVRYEIARSRWASFVSNKYLQNLIAKYYIRKARKILINNKKFLLYEFS